MHIAYGQSFFSDTDVRAQLIGSVDGNSPASMKWQGIESSQATSNIPIFRKSEMALIIAEFLGEGHFYSEARRLDKTITVMAGTCTTFRPANFVFPIPAAEINAGFMKDQNTGWEDGLPVRN